MSDVRPAEERRYAAKQGGLFVRLTTDFRRVLVRACACVRACVRARALVCVREREREKDIQTDR